MNFAATQTVLEAAAATSVEWFVNISTDKGANPSCVLDYSKRITERLTAYASRVNEGTYLSVRFGNVPLLHDRAAIGRAGEAQQRDLPSGKELTSLGRL